MPRPLLSVLIDTHNHERYIEQAIVSAVEQDFPASDYEIVVVDDGSTDRTPEIVQKFAPRVRLLRKENGGQASAFNAAFPELCGEIIAFLDGDDWFAAGKLRAVMAALEQHPEAAAVGHGYYEFHEKNGEMRPRIPEQPGFFSLASPRKAREARLGWPFLLVGALTVRRSMFERPLPISEALRFCADAPIATGALAKGAFIFPEALCYYRHHATNLHTVGSENAERLRQSFETGELMFEEVEALLARLGVSPRSITEFLCPSWVLHSRSGLRRFGGNRLRTFRTEMRQFRWEYEEPTLAYWMFKHAIVGAAALLLPARVFYRARDRYGGLNLGRFREQVARAAKPESVPPQ
jgi:glycosyltransferase involved in cell wall biosynthesis